MKCLRSGHCCIHYDVIIVDNPELGIVEDNLIHKPCGIKCQHLVGAIPGEYSCAIHDQPYYKYTPCFDYGQIEQNVTDNCRVGAYVKQNQRNS
jgi:hypothetical protein